MVSVRIFGDVRFFTAVDDLKNDEHCSGPDPFLILML